MASAQVLSNPVGASRKKEHLEAGKRRLEKFRKKKAAAKKGASTSQSRVADGKQSLENGKAHIDSVGAIADGDSAVAKGSSFLNHSDISHGFTLDSGSKSVPSENGTSQSHYMQLDLQKMEPKQEGKTHEIPDVKHRTVSAHSTQTVDRAGIASSAGEGRFAEGIPSSSTDVDNTSYYHLKIYGSGESLPSKDISSSESDQNRISTIKDVAASSYSDGHATQHEKSDFMRPTGDLKAIASEAGHLTQGLKEKNTINSEGNFASFYNHQASELISTASGSDVNGTFTGPLYSSALETQPRRTRPSFIDSINIGRDPPASDWSCSEKENFATSKFQSSNFAGPSAMQELSSAYNPVESFRKPTSLPSSNNSGNVLGEQKLFESWESKLGSNSQKQNEDFAALEQHIEDLTQEKFSLQRALDASKSLTESLASENSSLTESYNQQASIVTQLKAEMERLQGEIKARLVELESIKAEYMNVQLECSAADERAKLLASEVIGLEEKALRLRSSELKLERELENSSAEIASCKKKLSTLEKERQDMLQTIGALQEEKKLLQSKLRRASSSGILVDISQGNAKKDASTCTDDLGLHLGEADRDGSGEISSDLQGLDGMSHLLLLTMNRPSGVEDSATSIPPDQLQMIQNISSLISEIMAEKQELVQALVTEKSTSTKLKDLNKELSQKLEVQTQRLELLTSQSMASVNILAKQPTAPHIVLETVSYADEGDEVVERVLGWIMKLFPGGPSKRKTSRL